MVYKFYDTSSLLIKVDNLFNEKDTRIIISSVTLEELEKIKVSTNKEAEIKYAARKLLHVLLNNKNAYDIHIFNNNMLSPLKEKGLDTQSNDMRILATALDYDNSIHPDETIFVANDLSLLNIANLFFGEDSIEFVSSEIDEYSGYKEIILTDEELSEFYLHPNNNIFNLFINEYLIIKNINGEIVDKLCWTGECYRPLKYTTFYSRQFGQVKPIKGDIYQYCLADSLLNNTITMIKGPAGTGKTFMALGYLLSQLDNGKIDKIIVFCNTIATKDSARLGFYPGTRDEKLLDSQIGNLLSSKLGGRIAVEHMIQREQLVLLPMSDIRGYDTTGMRAGIYISEAQNLSVDLMKLALQRIGEDSICIIDGDCKTQVDDIAFSGVNNGMRRASQVFRGNNIYGEIELKNIHRSKIANIAEKM